MKCIALCILSFVLISNCVFAADPTSSTSSTTVAPSSSETPSPNPVPSTSPPEPAPSPSPQPILRPEHLQFNITDASNKDLVCALFSFDVTIRLLPKPDDHENSTEFYLLNTTTSTDKSACSANVTTLQLSLNGTDDRLTLELEHSGSMYSLDKISLLIGKALFESNEKVFNVDDTKSYLCQSGSIYKLNSTNPKETAVAHVIVNNLNIDAFRTTPKDNNLRQAIQCEADYPTNDFVPLAVGCALISLVLIVLIAYIVGRRRSKRLAYTSV